MAPPGAGTRGLCPGSAVPGLRRCRRASERRAPRVSDSAFLAGRQELKGLPALSAFISVRTASTPSLLELQEVSYRLSRCGTRDTRLYECGGADWVFCRTGL